MSKLSDIWDYYLNRGVSYQNESEFFYTKLIDEKYQHPFYAGVNNKNSILIALETKKQPPVIESKVDSIKSFRHQRHNGKWLFIIQLAKYNFKDVFEKLCDDLIESSLQVKSTEVALSITLKRLQLWIDLLSKTNNGFLHDFQVRGLLAELNFIKILSSKKLYTISQAINSWVGPSSAPQDFIFENEAFEIKSIILGNNKISISSLEQLDFKEKLTLVVSEFLQCNANDYGHINLNILYQEIIGYINDGDLLSIFNTKLLEVGYFPDIYYDEKNYKLIGTFKYIVDETFPKILRKNVAQDILNVSYIIKIENIFKENF